MFSIKSYKPKIYTFCAVIFLTLSHSLHAIHFGKPSLLGHFGNQIAGGLLVDARQKDSGLLSVQYEQTFTTNPYGITRLLFFNGSYVMRVSAAPRTTANTTDIYCTNFLIGTQTLGGLATTGFDSLLTFKPKIKTYSTYFGMHYNLGDVYNGLYAAWHIPFTHLHWKANVREIALAAPGRFIAGDISNNDIDTTINSSATSFLAGQATGGQYNEPLRFGKFNDRISVSKIGNAKLKIGYSIIDHDTQSLAVEAHTLLNGNGPSTARNWFEPSVGTAGRFGLGAGLKFHQSLFRKNILEDGVEKPDYGIDFYLDAQLTHLFARTCKRSYDVTRHGVGSRYMLAKKKPALGTSFTTANNIVSVINYTTLDAKINIDLLFDATALFRYTNDGLKMDFGYQLTGQTKENHKGWQGDISALIGMMRISGTNFGGADLDNVSTDIQIHGANAAGQTANALAFNTPGATITRNDLNIESGLHPCEISHTFLWNLEYGWKNVLTAMPVSPFVGVGTAYETGGSNNALNQWHFFINTGISF